MITLYSFGAGAWYPSKKFLHAFASGHSFFFFITKMGSYYSELSNRTFCDDENVLDLCCPVRSLQATCAY